MNRLITTKKTLIVFSSLVLFTGCADWNSVPVAVDDHFGDAVNHMIRAQTLNPNAGYGDQPLLGLDGQKSEGNIKVYRTGNTDTREGKTPVILQLNSSSN